MASTAKLSELRPGQKFRAGGYQYQVTGAPSRIHGYMHVPCGGSVYSSAQDATVEIVEP
ncbi:hypothetical protein [Streptomyces sp. SID3343]|uniref:hypothetical protein n=1 Tax=Streptomyces sp. SID3343 TaxID=2690260 RepID=UPI0013700D92|nr:hypothetical protein [Streptomyces sp. SID3343]